MLVNKGFETLIKLLHGEAATPWLPGTAQLRVGTGTTAVAPGNNDLTSSIGNIVQDLKVTNNTISGYATFGPTTANQNWREWGFFNTVSGTAGHFVMLNRVQKDMGTKVQGQTWKLSVRITVQAT